MQHGRKIPPAPKSEEPYTLYGLHTSYYTGKVETGFHLYPFPWKYVEPPPCQNARTALFLSGAECKGGRERKRGRIWGFAGPKTASDIALLNGRKACGSTV